jgi:hypothetical protein
MDIPALVSQYATPVVLLAVIGFVVGHFLTGHSAFKKDVYDKLDKRVEKEDCKDFREEERQRLKEHKAEGHYERD